jgi:transcriptional regulator with PAS, ATPase and Fis domain
MDTLRFQGRTLVVADSLMAETVALAAKAAKSGAPVLLCGESGTGKELIARFIHEKGERARGPYVSVNCAALPEGLMEAELFGYEKGAFTGAVALRVGKFERANQGTLLLDEISEMPFHLQAKLLRVLQEGEIDRLGARDTIAVNARILATTNREPVQLVEEGLFRKDLFFRLNVIRIDCPALRGRREAIENLSRQFVEEARKLYGRDRTAFSRGAMAKLLEYDWPGNVRELQNTIERAVLLSEDLILPEAIQLAGLKLADSQRQETLSLAEVEQGHIDRVLKTTGGNRNEAARILGISARTLRNKLNP